MEKERRMDQAYPIYTPVEHIKDGYKGWVYDTTTSKDYFTGNIDCPWQYRIWVEDGKIKIAPQEDLKINNDQPVMPDCIEQQQREDSRYRKRTYLNALGYKLTDTTRGERWDILIKVAVPYLGARRVTKTVIDLIYGRSRAIPKNANAIYEWNYDLDKLIKHYNYDKAIFDRSLLQYIINTKLKLAKHNIDMEVSPQEVDKVYRQRCAESLS